LTSDNRRQRESQQATGTPDKTPSPHRTIGYVSGVLLATGAAVALGVNVSHRSNAATGTPVVSESRPIGSLTTGIVTGSKSSQVAQASSDDELEAKVESLARLSAQDDVDGGGKADIHTFESVYGLVEDHYVDQLPDDTKMSRGAVRGMISSLNDPNSFFLEPEQRALFEAEAHGRFAGIGAVTSIKGQKKDGYTEYKIVVIDPLPGSPAAKAGLKSGDTITHVDGKWVLGSDPFLKVNKLYQKIRDRDSDNEDEFRKEYEVARKRVLGGIGLLPAQMLLRKGTTEKRVLTVQRPGAAAPLTISMTNALTEVTPVTISTAANGKATVLKINLFTEKTVPEVKAALAKIPKG
jgi:C-terminal processing protease CtpA/Prc